MEALTIPQLRVRTEFSFRNKFDCLAYGPVGLLAETLRDLGAGAAGIVDGGTWGHVKWAQACKKAGLSPLFGCELAVRREDGRAPMAWALAEDTAQFYQFSTRARALDSDVEAEFAEARGVIRFAGAALTDPATFDYVDLNPESPVAQAAAIALAKRTRRPLVLTSLNTYPRPEDAAAFGALSGRSRSTPQHLLTVEEMRAAIPGLSKAQFKAAVASTREAAERGAKALPLAPGIHFEGDLARMARDGQALRLAAGHLSSWPAEYEARLVRELEAVRQKDFDSYFLVVSDLVKWAKERMLVGPGRGSSAGSLLCYVLRITEVDPIKHGLLFERFIDMTRADLPDIDIDFSDTKRDLIFQYLADEYGAESVARIGSVNTMKPRSVLDRIGKAFGIPKRDCERFANVIIEYSSGDSRYGKSLEDTLSTTQFGKQFVEMYPSAALMTTIENHASHSGVHAAGVIVSNHPIADYCTVGPDGIAQIDKPDAEALNLLKIDALGLSTLGVIEDAGCVTADELYALTPDDPKVLALFNTGRLNGVFQFEGSAQRRVAAQVRVRSFEQVDHITALARPGPLGGGAMARYCAAQDGAERGETAKHERYIAPMVSETHGVVLYQEQVMRIVREIGKFSWAQTTTIRKAMSGRKGKEFFDAQAEQFVAGAAQDGIAEEDARAIWDEICSFGAWGMNKSHTCAYAMIAYWCAWMKTYHTLDYAAAALRKEQDETKALRYLRELHRAGVEIVPVDIARSQADWSTRDGALIGGFKSLHGFGDIKAASAVSARNSGTMSEKLKAQILSAKNKFASIYPITDAYGKYYSSPEECGVAPGWSVLPMASLPEDSECVFIGRVIKKELRDENETVRVAKRGGKLRPGQTLFTDLFLSDDSDEDVIARIRTKDFFSFGRAAFERLAEGEDVVLVRGRRYKDSMVVFVDRFKCLTNPGLLS